MASTSSTSPRLSTLSTSSTSSPIKPSTAENFLCEPAKNHCFLFALNDERFSDRILFMVRSGQTLTAATTLAPPLFSLLSLPPLISLTSPLTSLLPPTKRDSPITFAKVSLKRKQILSLDDEDCFLVPLCKCAKEEVKPVEQEPEQVLKLVQEGKTEGEENKDEQEEANEEKKTEREGEEEKKEKKKEEQKEEQKEEKKEEADKKELNKHLEEEVKQDQNEEVKHKDMEDCIMKLHVSSILLASASKVFRAMLTNGMSETKTNIIKIEVADEEEANLLLILIRFIYTGTFLSNEPEPEPETSLPLLPLLMLADKFGMEDAVKKCCHLLSYDLNMQDCLKYLTMPESLLSNESWKSLISKCHSFIAAEYQDFENLWLMENFLTLNEAAVVLVLSSEALQIRCEHTIYRAASRWWQFSANSIINQSGVNKDAALLQKAAMRLISTVRFRFLTVDFLMDVVVYDTLFMAGADETKYIYSKCIEYHALSVPRRVVIGMVSPRSASEKLFFKTKLPPHYWALQNVSKIMMGETIYSRSFYVDGYYFRLMARRPTHEVSETDAFGLFLSLDLKMSGLQTDSKFFLQSKSEFLYRNVETKEYKATEENDGEIDTFKNGHENLGYYNICKCSWANFIKPGSKYVDAEDKLFLAVNVALVL